MRASTEGAVSAEGMLSCGAWGNRANGGSRIEREMEGAWEGGGGGQCHKGNSRGQTQTIHIPNTEQVSHRSMPVGWIRLIMVCMPTHPLTENPYM